MVGSIKIDLVGMGIPCFQNSHTGYNSTLVITYLFLTSFQPVILCRHREGKFAVSQVPWM